MRPRSRFSAASLVACLLALRGETDRALDSLEKVAAALPALTRARIRRDVDLESLRGLPRFEALLGSSS